MTSHEKQRKSRQPVWRRVYQSLGGIFALNIFLSGLVSSLFVGYLVLNNQATASGFAVRDLEKQIAVLRDEADRLDLQVVAMQAMNNVEQQVGELGFVPVENLNYISAAPAIVAVK
ncbi:MAG: hypothetical protein V1738_02645 [Patescibacteria group bacterium]